MRRSKVLFLTIMLLPILSGCWSSNEAERMLYVHGLGIDYEENKYKIYVQIINFTKVAKSEQPSNDANQSEVGYATGETVDEAIFNLYHTIDQRIFWGHLTYIVFSEEALKEGRMSPAIDNFVRYRETRYQIWLYSTEDSVQDILLTVPIINTALTLSKLGNPENSFNQESFIEPIEIRRMIIGLDEPGHDTVIPRISITQNWQTVEGKDKIASLTGVGVVSPNEFKGFLIGEQAYGLQWMNPDTKRGEITFPLNSEVEEMVTVILDKVKVKVKPIVEGDSVRFDIDVKMNGTVGFIRGKTNYDELRKKTEQAVKKEIKHTYEEALKKDVDIYRFSEQLYRQNVNAWKKVQQKGKIELSQDSIRTLTVKVKIKTGRKSLEKTIK